MRALGIDPGTSSFDVCCIGDSTEEVLLEESIPTEAVAKQPERLYQVVADAKPDVVVGPSAMGMPFKHISEVTELDVAYATMAKNTEVDVAVRKLIQMLKASGLNVYFVPGVVQLPTVPAYRKLNKVDMGTADKTCIAALAIWDHARIQGVEYAAGNLVVVELGFGFNSAIAVERGQVIDGVGGTSFPGPGYLTMGSMDLELPHLLGGFSELHLAEGGASYAASGRVVSPELFAKRLTGDARFREAWRSFQEGVVKSVAMMLSAFEKSPGEVVLSGRLSRVPALFDELSPVVERVSSLPVRRLEGFARKVKEAAQGAALLANGVAGGAYQDLVEVMRVKEARGTVLDHVRLPGFNLEAIMRKRMADMRM
ncbi:MAG: DUF1464 family protein [Candidatus Bathyarchaeia archaeon]